MALRGARSCDIETRLHRIRSLKASAERWRPLESGCIPPPSISSRAELHTRLDCCLLEIFIGRPFILVHLDNPSGYDIQRGQVNENVPAASAHRDKSPIQPSADQEALVQDCISAAKAAIEICHFMQTGVMGLTRSSYIEYSSCRAALLVLIAYSISCRTNQFSEMLQRGFDAIREMALTGDSARSEISLLETLEAALHHLHTFDSDSQSPSADDTHALRGDYDGFVRWYESQKSSGESSTNARHPTTEETSTQHAHSRISRSNNHGSGMTATVQTEVPSIDQWSGFDLRSTGQEAEFFNHDFSLIDTLENDMLDSLLWIPD